MKSQSYKDMGEEDTYDFHHSTDHFDLAQNDATGPSSNCPPENVDHHDEPSTNAYILQYELRHVLDSMVDEHEEIPLEHFVVPFVVVDDSKIFKSTLVSQLHGNPTLSKDSPTRIKLGMLYTKPKKEIWRVGDNDFNLKLGCDCALAFVTEAMIEKLKRKRKRPSKSKALTTKTWYLGRVYKMRRKFANRWVEYREPIDLLERASHMEFGLCWYQKIMNHYRLMTWQIISW